MEGRSWVFYDNGKAGARAAAQGLRPFVGFYSPSLLDTGANEAWEYGIKFRLGCSRDSHFRIPIPKEIVMHPILIVAIPVVLVIVGMILNSIGLSFNQPPTSAEEDPAKRAAAEGEAYRGFLICRGAEP